MAIAITSNDKCYSTALNGHNPFNTDGQERTTLDVETARSALDFKIEKCKSYDAEGREIPNLFHLERDTDRAFIHCRGVAEGFTPIQHLDVFDYIVNEIMPNVPDAELEMTGTIHGCATGLFAMKMGGAFSIKGDESAHVTRLFFSNPTNGTGSLIMGMTNVRVVCQNTLVAATKEAKQDGFKIYHTKGASLEIKGALNAIAQHTQAALEMRKRCELLAGIGVNRAQVEKALDAVYPLKGLPEESFGYARMKNLRLEVLRQFEEGETAQTMSRKDSAWALFNSFTYPIFNPNEKRLEKSKTKDKAEIAYKGMASYTGDRVRGIFDKVERVALSA